MLRRLGTLRHLLGGFLDKGFPSDAPRVETILLIGAAQILWLEVPDHAAVDLSVRLAQADRRAARYAGLINAVLRRVAQAARSAADQRVHATRRNGCWRAGRKRYGADTARAIAQANGHEPALDLTVKADAASWAERLRGRVLPTGTVRTDRAGRDLAAAGLQRRRLVGAGRRRLAAGAPARRRARAKQSPICARRPAARPRSSPSPAPASPRSTARPPGSAACARISARLALKPRPSPPTSLEWQGGPFDAVLLDAPCSSTGTIRRHPDVPWLKSEADISVLAALQQRLLDRAVELLKPGATLVYCVCSLEPEEAEDQIAALLARDPRLVRTPVAAPEVCGRARIPDRGRRPAHAAAATARPRSALGRARRLLCRPAHPPKLKSARITRRTAILDLWRPFAIVRIARGIRPRRRG